MKLIKTFIAISLIVSVSSIALAMNLQPGKNITSFESDGDKVAAFLFLPADFNKEKKYPTVVVSPPASGVKEQTAGLYAEKLSKKGYITLAFDPRGWGESGGRRAYFSPYKIAEDTRNAINYLSTIKQVDTARFANLGICMGAGIAAYETAFDARVKVLAVVSPYLPGRDSFIKMMGGAENIRKRFLPVIAMASQKYYATGQTIMRKMVPETEEEMKTATAVGIGMRDYYLPGKPGGVKNWRNEQSFASANELLSFSIFHHIKMLKPVPSFVVYGDKAITANGAIQFYNELEGIKDQLILKGAGHFDIYWMPKYVDPAVTGIDQFFKTHLN